MRIRKTVSFKVRQSDQSNYVTGGVGEGAAAVRPCYVTPRVRTSVRICHRPVVSTRLVALDRFGYSRPVHIAVRRHWMSTTYRSVLSAPPLLRLEFSNPLPSSRGAATVKSGGKPFSGRKSARPIQLWAICDKTRTVNMANMTNIAKKGDTLHYNTIPYY